ncbi:MAG: hypothetical protein ACRDPY_39465 [Streptosporangiaceae bacterium]
MAPVSAVAEAVAYAALGARLVDVGTAGALIPAIRSATEDLLICGCAEGADLVLDAGLAARSGAGLICPDPAEAAAAVRRGIAQERILVRVTPAQIESAAESGWATMVDVGAVAGGQADAGAGAGGQAEGQRGAGLLAGVEAVAAVCGWLGVSVVKTRHVAEVRRALDMTETIRGTRPPSWTVRGLA